MTLLHSLHTSHGSDMQEESSSEVRPSLQNHGEQSMQNVSQQLTQIYELQNDAIRKKDREIEELHSLLQAQQSQLQAKDEEIRRLERERYRQQEERALELRSLFRRTTQTSNPYQNHDSDALSSLLVTCCSEYQSGNSTTRQRLSGPRFRLLDLVHSTIIFLLVLQF